MFKARNHREYQGVDEFMILKWSARIRVCGVDVDVIIYPRIGAICYVLRTRYSQEIVLKAGELFYYYYYYY
jgi:hypothetical protein